VPYKRLSIKVVIVIVAAVVLTAPGCMRGPRALRVSRIRYNQAVRDAADQQLLLNLVRLKYRDTPLFLEVGSVSAQFEFDESAGVGASIVENVGVDPINPTTFELSASLRQVEKPTITFTPLQGEDFVERVLTPISLDTVVLLARSGWRIDRVLRLTTQRLNGVGNAPSASGPTPARAPSFREFADVSHSLHALQARGWAELTYESRPSTLAAPLPAAAVEAADLIAAAEAGYSFRPADQGENLVLTGMTRSVVLSLAPPAVRSSEMGKIIRALNLAPGRTRYEVRLATGLPENDREAAPRDELAIETRSLLGIFFYLSQGVEAPPEHQEQGLVTVTESEDSGTFDWTEVTGDLLRIRCDQHQPDAAAVAVRYKGYWFYIDQADLDSKSTFALLLQLLALRAGAAQGVAPLLTLPIGG